MTNWKTKWIAIILTTTISCIGLSACYHPSARKSTNKSSASSKPLSSYSSTTSSEDSSSSQPSSSSSYSSPQSTSSSAPSSSAPASSSTSSSQSTENNTPSTPTNQSNTPVTPTPTVDDHNRVIVKVSNVQDLIAAIKSNTAIELAPGEYDMGEAVHSTNSNVTYSTDGITGGAVITNVTNLKISSSGTSAALLFSSKASDNVLVYDHCNNIETTNATLGHKIPAGGCNASVFCIENSTNLKFQSLDIYGCGTSGFFMEDSSNITVSDSNIHDCQYNAASLFNCNQVVFQNSKILNNGINTTYYPLFDLYNSRDISALGLNISGNGNPSKPYRYMFESNWSGVLTISGCTYGQNYYGLPVSPNTQKL